MSGRWVPELHPREKDGKFTDSSSGGSSWIGKLSDRIGNDMLSPELASTREGNQSDVRKWWDALTSEDKATVRDTIKAGSKKDTNVRLSEKAFNGLLSGGRLKTSHETSHGRGSSYDETRTSYEDEILGGRRPTYGYVGDPGSGDTYGDYEVTVKPEVRNRTTVSVGDSLNGATDVAPIKDVGKLNDRQLLSLINKHETQPGGLQDGNFKQYMEAQVDGGVSLNDVAFVTIPSDAPESVIKQLKKLGIKYHIALTEEDTALEAARRKLGLI